MGESNPTILTKTQKHESCEAFGKKSILTNILTKDQTNLTKIRELLIFHASGEKYNGIVNSSGLQKFVFEFKSTYPDETQGYTYKNIEEIAAKVFRTTPRNSKKLEMKQHKCVDCGSTEARHKSESIGGKITFRCDKCYDKYVYRSAKTPSNVDTVEVIS
jgi:predicted Zn-ribbon and HTH transcriptional regulator